MSVDRDNASIWIDHFAPPSVSLGWCYYPWQNRTRIERRAKKLIRLYAAGRNCQHCGELIPVWKRIDALYCKEGCRKMAARRRRSETFSVMLGKLG